MTAPRHHRRRCCSRRSLCDPASFISSSKLHLRLSKTPPPLPYTEVLTLTPSLPLKTVN
ncbi:hypothetical protein Hanom_Chr12g01144431 [Helianthus anomalus]